MDGQCLAKTPLCRRGARNFTDEADREASLQQAKSKKDGDGAVAEEAPELLVCKDVAAKHLLAAQVLLDDPLSLVRFQ